MAVESAEMADLNKMAAPGPDASKVKRPPEDFKGCKCTTWKCRTGNCPCYKKNYPCTWKCECVECGNDFGDRESDPNTGPVTWCKCSASRCANRRCSCMKVSRRCNSKCVCKNCANQDGASRNEAVQTTPPSNIESEQPEFLNSWVAELMEKDNGGSDPNKLP